MFYVNLTWLTCEYNSFFIQTQDGINPAMLESNANCEAQSPIIDPLVAQCNNPSNVHTSQQSVVSLPNMHFPKFRWWITG
jgi:hypothetical protein